MLGKFNYAALFSAMDQEIIKTEMFLGDAFHLLDGVKFIIFILQAMRCNNWSVKDLMSLEL